MTNLPPGLLMIIAAALLPFVPHMARQIVMLGAIALSAYGLVLGFGTHLVWDVIGFELVLYRADSLSFPFAVIFHIAAALNVIYSWHDKHWLQHCAALAVFFPLLWFQQWGHRKKGGSNRGDFYSG